MEKQLQNRVGVVTGGSRGIGRAIVLRLVDEGAAVTFCHQGEAAEAGAVLAEIEARQGVGFAEFADVANREEMEALFHGVIARHGRLDILVNNAGIQSPGPFVEHSEEDWRRVLDVNLTGTFICCQLAARIMVRQQSGRIVNIASRMYLGAPGVGAYPASKAGIVALTRSLATELGPHGIAVNCVAPGAIETHLLAAMPEAFRRQRLAETPLRRFGRPEEIAHAVVFLVSDESAFITGEVLHVTGGVYG